MSRYLSSLFITLFLYTLFLSLLFLNLKSDKIEKEKVLHLSLSTMKIEQVPHKKAHKVNPKKQKTIKKRKTKPHKVKHKPKTKTKSQPKSQPKKVIKKSTPQPKQIKKTPPPIAEQDIILPLQKPKNDRNSTKPTPLSPPKITVEEEYLKYNYQKIRSSIQELQHYPRRARKLHIEGEVKVRFLLKKDGSVEIKEMLCQKRFLKKATRRTIERASDRFAKPPKDLMIHITLVYKLAL